MACGAGLEAMLVEALEDDCARWGHPTSVQTLCVSADAMAAWLRQREAGIDVGAVTITGVPSHIVAARLAAEAALPTR